jgi:hypothetical protein
MAPARIPGQTLLSTKQCALSGRVVSGAVSTLQRCCPPHSSFVHRPGRHQRGPLDVMSISEFDRVRITRAIPTARVHRCRTRVYESPAVGDFATVLFAYPVTSAHIPPLFMVECSEANLARRWLADLHSSEMERVGAT